MQKKSGTGIFHDIAHFNQVDQEGLVKMAHA